MTNVAALLKDQLGQASSAADTTYSDRALPNHSNRRCHSRILLRNHRSPEPHNIVYTVAAANSKNKHPLTMLTVRSPMYFPANAPPATAMAVASAWPAVAPTATPSGLCAAPRAIVASILLSPHSARKMSVATSNMFAKCSFRDSFLLLVNSSTATSAPASSSSDVLAPDTSASLAAYNSSRQAVD
eukprot:GHUV01055186.1.p1 GENE.GHUV01055186.1~~GHUV01055186.1.p1  ORF type:complete len:186 (-),score=47.04 GHUV01055186.1:32-589(-)